MDHSIRRGKRVLLNDNDKMWMKMLQKYINNTLKHV